MVDDFATYMISHHVLILLITILQINKGDHFKALVPKEGKLLKDYLKYNIYDSFTKLN